jgi:DNA mismatch repair ATPase MutS
MMLYKELLSKYQIDLEKTIRVFNIISILRLLLVVVFLLCLYFYTKDLSNYSLIIGISSVIIFIILLIIHEKLKNKKNLLSRLVEINSDEIDFLNRNKSSYDDGKEFLEASHPYANDLDIFGSSSIFQYLNRTGTWPGKKRLADYLKQTKTAQEILDNQQAVAELSDQLNFRQELLSIAKNNVDHKGSYHSILQWAKNTDENPSFFIRILSFVVPVLVLISVLAYFVFKVDFLYNTISYLIVFNLIILYSQLKFIKIQIIQSDRIREIILHYAMMLEKIENQEFKSKKLLDLKEKISHQQFSSAREFKKLSSLFNSLESVNNLLGAVIFNGILLYHLHTLFTLLKWKKKYALEIEKWLDVIAELEALNSLANFAYNNPQFAFPEINDQYHFEFENLGHPLIHPLKRVDNSINMTDHPFVILTGSNMSGKSTFLRALGVNIVLASAGSKVCSSKARFHPLPLFVSMRLSDSLAEEASYFYAEIKRLKEITQALDQHRVFVLLDEILRGTNSDDKRNGTIAVIKKMISKKAIGMIATHDLDVCNISQEFPNYLSNKCFEVEIVDDNLQFNFILREGVSKNKSASFLMKKMDII